MMVVEHLLDAPEQELQDGGSSFQRDDTQGGCNLTGQYTAGRGVVPWSEQHDEGWGAEEDSTQMQGIKQLDTWMRGMKRDNHSCGGT